VVTGEVARGDDCDDANSAIHRTNEEECDGIDNDCDGGVDEGVRERFYPDLDRDGYGAAVAPRVMCSRDALPMGWRQVSGDCDDGDEFVSPIVPDGPSLNCDGRDNNCDGVRDAGCMCVGSGTVSCGVDVGRCRPGTTTCTLGMMTACAGGLVTATAEVCSNGASGRDADEDCDSRVDEGYECSSGSTSCFLCNGYGGPFNGTAPCVDCGWRYSLCSAPAVEVGCDSYDNNCDGIPDSGLGCRIPIYWGNSTFDQLFTRTVGEGAPGYDYYDNQPSFWGYAAPLNSDMVSLSRCYNAEVGRHYYGVGRAGNGYNGCYPGRSGDLEYNLIYGYDTFSSAGRRYPLDATEIAAEGWALRTRPTGTLAADLAVAPFGAPPGVTRFFTMWVWSDAMSRR
jgi:Putative metal-binding motif